MRGEGKGIIAYLFIFLLYNSCYDIRDSDYTVHRPVLDSSIILIMEKADKLIVNGDPDSAICIVNNAINTLNNISQSDLFLLYTKLGSSYFQKNDWLNSNCFFKKAIEKSQYLHDNNLDENFSLLVDVFFMISNNFRILNDFDSALLYLDIIQACIDKLDNDSLCNELNIQVLTWRGLVKYNIGKYDLAIADLFQAININKEQRSNECKLAQNYLYISEIYAYKQNFKKAELYGLHGIKIAKECYSDNSLYYTTFLNSLGLIYYESGKYQNALNCFLGCYDILEEKETNESQLVGACYNNLGDAYRQLGQNSLALTYYQKAQQVFASVGFKDELRIVYHNMGNAFYSQNDYIKSQQYFQKSLELSSQLNINKSIFKSYTYNKLAQIFFKKAQYSKAIEHYNLAIEQICIPERDLYNCDHDNLWQYTVSDVKLIEYLFNKGISEYLQFDQHKDSTQYILNAFNSFEVATGLLDIVRNQFLSENEKIKLNNIREPLFSYLVHSLLILRGVGIVDSEFDNALLESIERTKYTALRSSIHIDRVLSNSSIPTTSTLLLDSLNKKIRLYDGLLEKSTTYLQNGNDVQGLHDSLFKSIYSYDSVLNTIKEDFPGLKTSLNTFNYEGIEQTQREMPDSVAVLNYYINDSIIIIIAISSQDYCIHIGFLKESLDLDKKMLLNAIKFSNDIKFVEYSTKMYQSLISPIYEFISDYSLLVIIPDEKYLDLPYEVLMKSRDKKNLAKTTYLIEDFMICYHFSLNLRNEYVRNELLKTREYLFDFVGFAPFSTKNVEGFYGFQELPYSQTEIEISADIMGNHGGTVNTYCGNHATKHNIINGLTQSKIFHLATHSYSNSKHGEYCFLLSNSDLISQEILSECINPYLNQGKLSLEEIYTINTISDLVVLSTCSSGRGKQVAGDGTISLTRGLYSSGARNIIYTLWNISDLHTMKFMISFYNNFEMGYSYQKALQKTKIQFIKSNYSLPIFWGGFVINS